MRIFTVTALVSTGLGATLVAACSGDATVCTDNFCGGPEDASPETTVDSAPAESGPGPDARSDVATMNSDSSADASADVVEQSDSETGAQCDGATLVCNGACTDPVSVQHCGTCTTVCPGPPSGNGNPTCAPATGPDAGLAACGISCNQPAYALCNGDCVSTSDGPRTDPCVLNDAAGIFVAPAGEGGSDSNPGTKSAPVQSITHGLALAFASGRALYVCAAAPYAEHVSLTTSNVAAGGISIYGGLSCTGGAWAYSGTKVVVAPSDVGFALHVDTVTHAVQVEDFEFDAQPAPGSPTGASSIGALVAASPDVTLRRVAISAGNASDGAAGAAGVNGWSGVATTGNAATGALGGLSLSCTCGGTGGRGGNAGTYDSSSFTVLQPGADGVTGTVGADNHGTGAKQGINGPPQLVACTPGGAGAVGGPGTGGAGGTGPGALSAAGWTDAQGTGGDGVAGLVAEGGGGGGGGLYDPTVTPGGAAGSGGGGCGGCGGALGKGGAPGGSSIALISVTSGVTLDTCTLTARNGGAGGKGGDGQVGQTGGPLGPKAAGGCNGGAGGTGGSGGGGGGGAGGHSIALAYSGTAPTKVTQPTESVASTPAVGGQPGSGVAAANGTGAAGLTVAEQSF